MTDGSGLGHGPPGRGDWGFPPRSALVQVAFGAQSHPGRFHTANEDHYMVVRVGRHQETLLTSLPDELVRNGFDEYGYAMVVADGMGADGAGEAASRLAITTLIYLVQRFGKWNLRVDDRIAQEIMARAERFYRYVHNSVVNGHPEDGSPMRQTTLTAAFSAGHDLFFAHIGHSRVYLFRDNHLVRLTRDHMIDVPRSPNEKMRPVIVHPAARDVRQVLTRAVGMAGAPKIDLERLQLDDDDRVLVCTNGVIAGVDDAAIAAVLASAQPPEEQCQALIDLAVSSGVEDDATALIARYRFPT